MRQRIPPSQAAASRPLAHALQQPLRPVPKHPPIEVDEEQGGAAAEADRPPPRDRRHMRAVLFGEKAIPDLAAHPPVLPSPALSPAPLLLRALQPGTLFPSPPGAPSATGTSPGSRVPGDR